MNNILIKGYYGYNNLGDDIILYTILKQIYKMKINIDRVHILGKNESFAINFPDLNCIAVNASMRKNFSSIYNHIINSDYIILGGGGLFSNDRPFQANLLFLLLSWILGKKIIIFGVGINPIKNKLTRKIWNRIIKSKNIELVTLRDEFSYKNLCSFPLKKNIEKCHYLADLAFSIPSDSKVQSNVSKKLHLKKSAKYCLFSLAMPWGNVEERKTIHKKRYTDFLKTIVQIVRLVEETDFVPIFLPFFEGGDEILIDEIIELLGEDATECIIVDIKAFSSFEKRELFGLVDMSVNMRFHSIVFSTLHAVPHFSIIYDYKSLNLIEITKMTAFSSKIGIYKDDFFKDEFDLDTKEIIVKLKKLLTSNDTKNNLASESKKLQKISQMNFSLLEKIIKSKSAKSTQ